MRSHSSHLDVLFLYLFYIPYANLLFVMILYPSPMNMFRGGFYYAAIFCYFSFELFSERAMCEGGFTELRLLCFFVTGAGRSYSAFTD